MPAERELFRAELAEHTMYELLGGAEGIRSIVDHFYDLMDRPGFEPIRTMHAADLSPTRVALFEFLSGWLGGPPASPTATTPPSCPPSPAWPT